jgi:hypothetical protein
MNIERQEKKNKQDKEENRNSIECSCTLKKTYRYVHTQMSERERERMILLKTDVNICMFEMNIDQKKNVHDAMVRARSRSFVISLAIINDGPSLIFIVSRKCS